MDGDPGAHMCRTEEEPSFLADACMSVDGKLGCWVVVFELAESRAEADGKCA